jgi:hypothetical protein
VSLYRQAGERGTGLLVALLVAGLLVGGVAGFLAGRGSADDPTLAELIADARAELAPVARGLELVPIEYEGAVRNGKVIAPTEYSATQGAASRAAGDLEAAGEDIRAIDPAGYEAATAAITDLEAAIDVLARQARIDALTAAAADRVEALAGDSAQ